jgi:hypothetical protein
MERRAKVSRRTEITIETEEILILRRRFKTERIWCRQCAEKVVMLTMEEAAVTAGVSSRIVYQWIEGFNLHFTETPTRLLLVCPNSLSSITCSGESTLSEAGANGLCERQGGRIEHAGKAVVGNLCQVLECGTLSRLVVALTQFCKKIQWRVPRIGKLDN